LAERIREAIPLHSDVQKAALFTDLLTSFAPPLSKAASSSRSRKARSAAYRVLVPGIHAALLWAVVMQFLSLIPAVRRRAGLASGCVYFLATGAIWQGIGLILYGVLVIGLVDNLLRPFPGRQGHQTAGLRGADLHARRHRSLRPERFRHRPADRGNVHGELGNIFGIAGSGRTAPRTEMVGSEPGPLPPPAVDAAFLVTASELRDRKTKRRRTHDLPRRLEATRRLVRLTPKAKGK
jgi:hypothetical protein